MAFTEVNLMDSRRKLAFDVLENGVSLSRACARAGVTRVTGRLWVARALEVGIENMCERSRAPKLVANRTTLEVESALLKLKAKYPEWGAKKLTVLLADDGVSLSVRTADRILDRHGLTAHREAAPAEPIRFERAKCGALLQMDFKGLPPSTPYAILSVLDDMARFCVHFGPVADKTGPTVMAALWEVFGTHGLPDEMLMDNGDCWGASESCGPTRFEAWLMRLGVKPIHGRPRHPQTQGKVERFHGTAKLEMGQDLVKGTFAEVDAACRAFVHRYNWVRPHEGIGRVVPASRYVAWSRKRPAQVPEHTILEGAVTRTVCKAGGFSYMGRTYRIGKGLTGQRVVLKEAEFGMRVFYADYPLAYLSEMSGW